MALAKIIIHISDRDKWAPVLGQVSRLFDIDGESNLKVTLIADVFAGGVCIACNQSLRQQMDQFVRKGGRILVCEESLRFLNMKPENLPDFVQPVSNGVKEIIKLQGEGFRYIKA